METEVASYNEAEKTYDIICRSTHLTSFAVLLDVNNALSVSCSGDKGHTLTSVAFFSR